MATKSATVAVENVNRPGSVQHLDAGKYNAMKRAVLKVLPKASPGLTIAQVQQECSHTSPMIFSRAAQRPDGG